jgi:hypothetical protein
MFVPPHNLPVAENSEITAAIYNRQKAVSFVPAMIIEEAGDRVEN